VTNFCDYNICIFKQYEYYYLSKLDIY